MKSAYDEAKTDAEREALRDGVISDQEYAFFQQQIVICLKGIGVSAMWADDKSLEYTKPNGVTNEAIDKCNAKNGLDIVVLRDAIDRNPQQLDENEILLACLKRAKAVDPGDTPSMLAGGVGLDKLLNSESFDKCNADPLGDWSSLDSHNRRCGRDSTSMRQQRIGFPVRLGTDCEQLGTRSIHRHLPCVGLHS